MLIFGYTPKQIRKAIVTLVGVLTALLTANLLPETAAHWVSTFIGVVTVILTFKVPNDPLDQPGEHATPNI